MKLLLFLLMSVAVMGQDKDSSKLHLELLVQLQNEQIELYESALQNSKDATTSLLILVSQLEDSIKTLKQNNTIDLILAYADECYADSSLIYYNVYVYDFRTDTLYSIATEYDYDLGIDSGYKGQIEKWTHKQPTFEGFIEFIRRKTK